MSMPALSFSSEVSAPSLSAYCSLWDLLPSSPLNQHLNGLPQLPVQQEYAAALQKCVLRAEGADKQLAKGREAAQPSWDFEAI